MLHNKKLSKIIAASALSVSVFSAFSASTFAAEPVENPNTQQEIKDVKYVDESSDFIEAIQIAKILAPYLDQQEDGTYFLKELPENINVSPQDVADFKEGLEMENELIRNGTLSFVNDKLVVDEEKVRALSENIIRPSITTDWSLNGVKVVLSDQETQEMLGIMAISGGGAASLAYWFKKKGHPGLAEAAGLLTGLYSMGAGAIQKINAQGGNKGIYFKVTWGIGPLFSLWHN
ncbi:hypothetical protein [Aneurinibacillus aneurinilyticus]|uniref:hypothetical protein n=1 Tax=Aneurinibacillus aneurinilyticus TaxID=1391 RepID=UPI0023F49E8F|nr:hypothetical protein [Aneurinibacillus aneurinilyticus]